MKRGRGLFEDTVLEFECKENFNGNSQGAGSDMDWTHVKIPVHTIKAYG